MAADGSVVIEIAGDDSKFKKLLGGLGDITAAGMKGVTTAIGAAGAAVGALGVAAAKVGAEFEQTMANTSTMFGDVAVDTDGLNAKILELSNATGLAASQIGGSLYNALSAGVPVTEDMGDAMDYMESCTKLAKAGFTDVDTAVTSTAKVLNAYGMAVTDADKVQKIMMQTQNKGITTVGELGASLAQVTPTAAAMGVSFENVGAALATMTAQGTPTAQATTQLNSLLAELGKSGTQASDILKGKTGKSFKALMEEGYNLSDVLSIMQVDLSGSAQAISELMSKANAATGETMTFDEACANLGISSDVVSGELIDMFGSLEAGKAALAMAGDNSAKFTDNLAAMSTEADVVGDAYNKVTDTLENKVSVLKESVKNLGIAAYDGMEGPLKEAAGLATGWVEQIADAFSSGGLEGAVGAVGDVLAQMVGKAAEFAPGMIDAGITLLQSLLTGITQSLPQIVAGASGIVTSLVMGITTLLPMLADAALQLVTGLTNGIASALPALLPAAVGMLTALAQGLVENLPALLDAALQLIMGLADGLVESIPLLIDAIPQIIGALLTAVTEELPQILEKGMEILQSLIDGIVSSIPQLVAAITELIPEIVMTVAGLLPEIIESGIDILSSLITGIVTAIPQLIAAIPQIIVAIIGALIAAIPQILEAGVKLMIALPVAFIQAIPQIIQAIPQIIEGLKASFANFIGEFKTIGSNIVKGVWDGIKGMATWVKDKVTGFFSGIVDGVKGLLGIHSPSKVFAEMGKYAIEGYVQGVENQSGNLKDTMSAATDLILAQMPEGSDADAFLDDFLTAYGDNLDGMVDNTKGMVSELQTALDGIETAWDDVAEKQEKMKDKLANVGNLYTEKDGVYVLGDLQGEIDSINTFSEMLGALETRGISDGLMDEILSMNVEDAIGYGKLLLSKTDDEFTEYMALWDKKQALSKELATDFYQSELDTLETEYGERLADGLDGLKQTSFTSGQSTVDGLISGLKSKEDALYAQAKAMADGVARAMAGALQIHSPSKVTQKLGAYTGEGFGVGFEDSMANVYRRMQAAVTGEVQRIGLSAAAQAEQKNAVATKEVHTNTRTVEKPVRLVGDGVTGELVRMLDLKIEQEHGRVGGSLED